MMAEAPALKRGLDPMVDAASRVLILGTMPGVESLRRQEYYAYGRNQLWEILSRIYGAPAGSAYGERVSFLRRHGIALWDVLQSAERQGSLDSEIKAPVANDFASLFATYPKLERVGLNGTKAEALYRRFVAGQPGVPEASRVAALPSTSPTAGKHVLSLDEKIARWKSFLTGVE